MNDFTKEELKTIIWHITTKASIKPGNDLAPKIQDMIENYCDHKECKHTSTNFDDGIYYCNDCGYCVP